MIKLSEIRKKLQQIISKAELDFEKFNRSQRLYFLGCFFGLLSAFWYVTPFTDIFLTALIVSGIFLTFGVISDLLVIYKAVWETAIGKGVLLLLYALSTNIAYATASRLVNELVKFDTSSLTYTVNLVAILLAPVFIIIGTYAAFMIVLALGQIYLMVTLYSDQLRKYKLFSGLLPEPKENYPRLTFAARLLILPAVFGFLLAGGKNFEPKYEAFIENVAAAFIFNFEAARYSRCQIAPEFSVVKVSDEEIIAVGRLGDGFKFEPQKCTPTIKS